MPPLVGNMSLINMTAWNFALSAAGLMILCMRMTQIITVVFIPLA